MERAVVIADHDHSSLTIRKVSSATHTDQSDMLAPFSKYDLVLESRCSGEIAPCPDIPTRSSIRCTLAKLHPVSVVPGRVEGIHW